MIGKDWKILRINMALFLPVSFQIHKRQRVLSLYLYFKLSGSNTKVKACSRQSLFLKGNMVPSTSWVGVNKTKLLLYSHLGVCGCATSNLHDYITVIVFRYQDLTTINILIAHTSALVQQGLSMSYSFIRQN